MIKQHLLVHGSYNRKEESIVGKGNGGEGKGKITLNTNPGKRIFNSVETIQC